MSQEVEHEQRRKIQELERELAASEEIQCRQWLINTILPLTEFPADYDATLQKLVNADAQIESLKEQLDATLGAEDMLERLTERNLTMQEVRPHPDDYHIADRPSRKLKKCESLSKIWKRSRNSMMSSKRTMWRLRRPSRRKSVGRSPGWMSIV